MSNRKIINAAATGGIGYYPVAGASSDAYYDNVSLLLNGDVEVDSNFANVSLLLDGNTLTDKSNNKAAVTVNGGVTASSVNKKFGTGSCLFDGSSGYLSIPASSAFDLSSNTFTIEAWVYQTSNSGNAIYSYVVDKRGGGGTWGLLLSGGVPSLMYGAGMSESYGSTAIPLNIWTHIAASVSSGTLRMFINGVQTHTASGLTFPAGTAPVWIGRPNSYGYYFAGNIDDLRITKGVARYTSNFTPPVKAFPTHEILDSSVYRLPVTAVGNARIDTTTKKFGTGAMYFDGSGDYLTLLPNINLAFPADFTIELWFNSSSFAAQRTLMSTAGYYVAGNNGNWTFRVTSASSIAFAQYNSQSASGGGWEFPVPTMTTGTWYHVALTRSNGTISLYLNGVASSTTYSNLSNISDGGVSNVYVGHNVSYDNDWFGYIDDLRITKGSARYTANFTPPTASLPTVPPTIPADPWWGNVSLLLDGNTTDAYDPYWQNVSLMLTGDDFIDWSNQHNAITVGGNTAINTTTKKFNSGSMYFDGSGDYITIPSITALNIGSGDYTFECWVYPTSSARIMLFGLGVGGLSIAINASGNIEVCRAYQAIDHTFTAGVVTSQWQYITVTRQGTSLKAFKNGNLLDTQTNSTTYVNGTTYVGTDVDGYSSPLAGYIADFRITKGVARYTANFTVPTAALPAYKIQDRTQNNLTVTPYGNVQLSTDVMKNGTGSMFFDGTGDYVNVAGTAVLDIKTGDFTLEAWIYPTVSHTNYGRIFHFGPTWAANCYGFSFDNAGKLKFQAANLNGGSAMITSSSVITVNAWSHVAVTRSGSLFNLFVNGVSQGTYTDSTALSSTANQPLYIGMDPNGSATYTGYIDDARITQGYARYTQNFTPPSQSFATQYISTGYDANYADVSLLLNGNGTNGSTTFTDLSSTPKTVTAYGNAKISTAVKKYGTGAMAFDGSGDYFSVPYSTNLLLNSVNSTLEGWFYLNASPGGPGSTAPFFCQTDITNSSTSGGSNFWCFADSTNIYFGGGGQSSYLTAAVSNIPISQWFHLAIVITAGVSAAVYINGVSKMSGTIDAIGSNSAYSTFIGACKTGVPPGTLNSLNGYADDLRITKGIARYTTNFTPPTYQLPTDTTGAVIDPLRSSTSLLLRGNGTNGSTSFTDESPNGLTVTNNGSVTVNTTTKKYGTGSMAFSGSGQWLTLDGSTNFTYGTSDFTIEFWIQSANWGGGTTIFYDQRPLSTDGNYPLIYTQAGQLRYFVNSADRITGSTLSANTWYHIAICRLGTSTKMFVNGVQDGSTYTDSTSYINGSNRPIIATRGFNPGDNTFSGYIDDLRITKGYARYTANFTPPTYEDPIVTGTVYDYNYPQVSLLLNGDGTNGSTVFTDLSSSPKTITNTGSVTVNTTTKKFGTGSMAFSGSNYLTIPSSSQILNFGTGNFTIEMWCYVTSGTWPTYVNLLDSRSGDIYAAPLIGIYGGQLDIVYDTSARLTAGTVSLSTWNHFAFVRNNTSLIIYLNGVNVGSVTISSSLSINSVNSNCYIGTGASLNWYLSGYMDDFRITKGLARYTQNFTPPTAPLPTSYS